MTQLLRAAVKAIWGSSNSVLLLRV